MNRKWQLGDILLNYVLGSFINQNRVSAKMLADFPALNHIVDKN